MTEKREYSRLKIKNTCLIYYNNKEIVAAIEDISENGICFKVTDCQTDINRNDKIVFVFTDSVFAHNYVILAKAQVIWTDKNYIGCKVKRLENYISYVGSKRGEAYLKNIKQFDSKVL